ncbi:MAG: hypothetical protein C5S49_07980 [Candidatus Methanogaster sp.]|nr:MAG: hypothetical protein C5S49_07980 [ANME-2 cluster archaeon]
MHFGTSKKSFITSRISIVFSGRHLSRSSMNTTNLLSCSCKHSAIAFSKSSLRVLFILILLSKKSFASLYGIPVVFLNTASMSNLPMLSPNSVIFSLDPFPFCNSINICCNNANPIGSPRPYAQALNQIVLTLLSFLALYIFSSSFSFLTFRSWVRTLLIFRVAFLFSSSIVISADSSYREMVMVLSSLDLRISAPSAQPMLRSSRKKLRSSPLTFPGTLSQLNRYPVYPSPALSSLIKRLRILILACMRSSPLTFSGTLSQLNRYPVYPRPALSSPIKRLRILILACMFTFPLFFLTFK